MIDDLYQDGTDQVLADLVRRPKPEPAPPAPGLFSGTGASIGQNLRAGAARTLAFGAEISGAFGSVVGAYPEAIGAPVSDEQRKQADEARKKLLAGGPTYTNEAGSTLRQSAADWMPDPKTTGRAAQIVGGFVGFGSEYATSALFGGPLAPFVLGGATGFDEADKLRLEGVDLATRAKAAAVTGAANTAMTAIPLGAATRAGAAAKGLVVGEGATVGQTAAVQSILRNAGYDKIASQYDPFDPVALAVGAVPGFLGAAMHGGAPTLRPTKLSDVVMSIESGGKRYGSDGQLLTSPKGAQGEMQVMPATSRDPGYGVAPAKDGSPEELARVGRDYLDAMVKRYDGDTDKAMAAYNAGPGALEAAVKAHPDNWLEHLPAETQAYVAKGRAKLGDTALAFAVKDNPEIVRAARVVQTADAADASRLTHDSDLAGMDAHDAAMQRAHDQLGAGERVDVSDVIGDRFDPTKVQAALARIDDIRQEAPEAGEALAGPEPFADFATRALAERKAAGEAKTQPDNFLGFLRSIGGVQYAHLADLTGEKGVRQNRGAVFKKNGRELDDVATLAAEAGYLSPDALTSIHDNGGTRAVGELIRRAMAGERIEPFADGFSTRAAAAAEDAHARHLENRLAMLGIDASHARGDTDVMQRYLDQHGEALANERFAAIADEARPAAGDIIRNVGLTEDMIDLPAKLAIAGRLDYEGASRAAREATDPVDFLARIEEILGNGRDRGETGGSGEAAGKDAGVAAGNAEPRPAGGEPAASPEQASALDRNLARLEAAAPDMPVLLEGGEKTTLSQALAEIRAQFDADTADAKLAQVAAECFLRAGA